MCRTAWDSFYSPRTDGGGMAKDTDTTQDALGKAYQLAGRMAFDHAQGLLAADDPRWEELLNLLSGGSDDE